jgi:hypothetical protein
LNYRNERASQLTVQNAMQKRSEWASRLAAGAVRASMAPASAGGSESGEEVNQDETHAELVEK